MFTNTAALNYPAMRAEVDKIGQIQSSQLYIQVIQIGSSVQAKSLDLIKIQPLPAQPGNIKVMVIARQHGDEPAGTSAVFFYISDLVNGCRQLNGVTLFLASMVNPDGADNNTRNNANGKNLNRDWDARTQPEVQAVYNQINTYNPEVFLDLHEFTAYSGRNFK